MGVVGVGVVSAGVVVVVVWWWWCGEMRRHLRADFGRGKIRAKACRRLLAHARCGVGAPNAGRVRVRQSDADAEGKE